MRILTIILLLLSISVSAQRTRPLSSTKFIDDANLVSYWQMSDANDYKNANNGTGSNMSYSAGKFGNAGNFNGSSSKITLSSNSSIKPTSFTISAWINPAATTDMGIFHLYHQYNPSGTYLIYGFNFHIVSRKITIAIGNGSYPSNVYEITGTSTINTSTWYHVLATYNGTNAYVYVNGLLETSGAATLSYSSTDNVGMIGTYLYSQNANPPSIETDKFNGSIDDMAIFSRALSSTEVQELYQGMTAGEYIPNSSTAGYWRLNGNSMDYSSNANNGTDANITYGTAYGRFGQGGSFNGSSSKITLTDNASLRPSSAFTISAWIKKASGTDGYMIFNNFAGSPYYGYQFLASGHNAMIWVKSSSEIKFSGATTIDDNVWHHVISTWDGSNLRLYVDGKLDATPVACTSISYTTTMYAVIGTQYTGSTRYTFNGSIDEVILESRAWSAQEIRNYYTQSKGRFTNN